MYCAPYEHRHSVEDTKHILLVRGQGQGKAKWVLTRGATRRWPRCCRRSCGGGGHAAPPAEAGQRPGPTRNIHVVIMQR